MELATTDSNGTEIRIFLKPFSISINMEKEAEKEERRSKKAQAPVGETKAQNSRAAEFQKALRAPVHLLTLEKDREAREKRKQEWSQSSLSKEAKQTVTFVTENGKECNLSRRILFIQGTDTMKKFFGLPMDNEGRYKFGDKDAIFELLTSFMCKVDRFEPPQNFALLRKLKHWAFYFRMDQLEDLCREVNPALSDETQIKKVGGMGVVKSSEDLHIAHLSGPLAVHDHNTSSLYTEKHIAPGDQVPTTGRRPLSRGTKQAQGAAVGTSQIKSALKQTDQPAPLPPPGRYAFRRGREPSATEPPSKRSRVHSWHGA